MPELPLEGGLYPIESYKIPANHLSKSPIRRGCIAAPFPSHLKYPALRGMTTWVYRVSQSQGPIVFQRKMDRRPFMKTPVMSMIFQPIKTHVSENRKTCDLICQQFKQKDTVYTKELRIVEQTVKQHYQGYPKSLNFRVRQVSLGTCVIYHFIVPKCQVGLLKIPQRCMKFLGQKLFNQHLQTLLNAC